MILYVSSVVYGFDSDPFRANLYRHFVGLKLVYTVYDINLFVMYGTLTRFKTTIILLYHCCIKHITPVGRNEAKNEELVKIRYGKGSKNARSDFIIKCS